MFNFTFLWTADAVILRTQNSNRPNTFIRVSTNFRIVFGVAKNSRGVGISEHNSVTDSRGQGTSYRWTKLASD
jgi:hypothetical protein